jgi:uncharacterized protein (TIGR02145 family)
MRKIALLLPGLAMSLVPLWSQHDSLYIMKSGTVLGKYATAEIDSIIFYSPVKAGLTVSDFDGNIYPAVTLGTQTWMAQNLRTTHYADGTPIPGVAGAENWAALEISSQAYCWYDDDSTRYAATYGALYTWEAAMKGAASTVASPSGVQGVCPNGWHLPSDDEWTILVNYLINNGYNYDGTSTGNKIGKALAADTNWTYSNAMGTVGNTDYPAYRNKTGMTAMPAGYRDQWGEFFFLGSESHWLSATEYSSTNSLVRSLFYYSTEFIKLHPSCYYKKNGFSVRCLKD